MSQPEPQGGESTYRSYKELRVWQKGIELAQVVYQEMETLPASSRSLLGSVLVPVVVAIPAGIANGYASRSKTDYVANLKMALGKLSELEALLLMQSGSDHSIEVAEESLVELRKMLAKLTTSLTKPKTTNSEKEAA